MCKLGRQNVIKIDLLQFIVWASQTCFLNSRQILRCSFDCADSAGRWYQQFTGKCSYFLHNVDLIPDTGRSLVQFRFWTTGLPYSMAPGSALPNFRSPRGMILKVSQSLWDIRVLPEQKKDLLNLATKSIIHVTCHGVAVWHWSTTHEVVSWSNPEIPTWCVITELSERGEGSMNFWIIFKQLFVDHLVGNEERPAGIDVRGSSFCSRGICEYNLPQ